MLINCVAYRDGTKLADLDIEEISDYLQRPECFVWVALRDATDAELEAMQRQCLHDLAVEDARHGHQRPKIEEYSDSLFAVMHMLEMENGEILVGESMCLPVLITFYNIGVDALRDAINTAILVCQSTVGIEQNEVNKRLAAWAAIFAVTTALAGIWGMNFESMPELRWEFGYPVALFLMAVVASYLYLRFKRFGWL